MKPGELGVRFGPSRRLAGVLTPAHGAQQPVGCVLFNAGVVHRIGPHRINVQTARALSRQGIATLRMDLSGIGDSAPAQSTLEPRAQALADLQAGMSRLHEVSGVDRFVVVGICSAAEHAYALALEDARVRGILMFDGFAFPTPLTRPICRFRRLLRLRVATLPRRVTQAIMDGDAGDAASLSTVLVHPAPSRDEFRAALDQLVDRGVAVNIMYSGSVLERHSYSWQLHHAFRGARFLDDVDYAYLPALDHTLVTKAAQREFVERTVDWAVRTARRNGTTAPLASASA